jgi:hypothetical protein
MITAPMTLLVLGDKCPKLKEKTKDKGRDGKAREGEDKEADGIDPFIEVEKEGASVGAQEPTYLSPCTDWTTRTPVPV